MRSFIFITLIPIILSGCLEGGSRILSGGSEKSASEQQQVNKNLVTDANYKINFAAKSDQGPNFLVKFDKLDLMYDDLGIKTIASPIVVNNVIYLLDNRANVIALDLLTKKELWKLSLNYNDKSAHYYSGSMVYDDEIIYLTYGDIYVVAVNAKTGYEIYRKKTNIATDIMPVVYKGNLYVQSMNDSIEAIDAKTGKLLWRQPNQSNQSLSGGVPTPIIYQNKWLISFDSLGRIVMNNLFNGAKILEFEPEFEGLVGNKNYKNNFITQSLLYKNSLYLVFNDNYVINYNIEKNAIIWQTKIADLQKIALCGNAIIAVTSSAEVLALSSDRGSVVWSQHLLPLDKKNQKSFIITSPPIIANDNIFVATKGALYKLTSCGSIVEKFNLKPVESFLELFIYNNQILLFADKFIYSLNNKIESQVN